MVFGVKFLFIIFSCFLFAFPEKIEMHYEKGINAYQDNQYELSVQEFESILNDGWNSPELYYNLGNAYYRLGNIPGAIWSYESCLKIFPNHQDAIYNLKLTNLRVKDRVVLPNPPIYLKWYMNIKERFTPNRWITITLFFLLLFSMSMVIPKIITFDSVQYLSGIILTIFFVCLFLTLHSIWTNKSDKEGIIYKVNIETRSEPNKYSTRLFEVHGGLKVIVNQHSNNWVRIELLDGKAGWIEKNHVRMIQ